MTILGIETSADETAIAILDIQSMGDIRVRASVVSSQIALHTQHGGIVPNLAAREHVANIGHVLESALKEGGIASIEKEIDLISVTRGPGLGPALLVGIAFAKTLAWKHTKPLVGADHMRGHIYSNWLDEDFIESEVKFPILNLVVSGGHTELVLMHNYENFELIGETMDDAVGEAFDKVARLLGLGYPGGPAISKLATEGNPERFPLPRPMLHSKDFNFSYSGLKTAVLYLIRDLKEKGVAIDEQTRKDIAASFQTAAIDVLIKKTLHAAQKHGVDSVMLSGGVSANSELRNEFQKMAEGNNLQYSRPKPTHSTDNAAMIAVAGYAAITYGQAPTDWQSVNMDANLGF